MGEAVNLVNSKKILGGIKSIKKTDTEFMIHYDSKEQAKLNILNSHVFRYYMSPTGEFLEYPVPNNPEDLAKINVKKVTDYDTKAFQKSFVEQRDQYYIVHTNKIKIFFDKINGTMTVRDKRTNKDVLKESQSLSYADSKVTQILHQHTDEYFFGGGMQNGRFTHKGEVIDIVNTNNWEDGGVTSPCPFYWSSYGYGVLRNSWQPGFYDFGLQIFDIVRTVHEGQDFDAFFFINSQPRDILIDYYELTGQPIFMPEYAFYEAHLNAFNRDYWVKVDPDTPGAILFEDGLYYRCYNPSEMDDKKGILESLNGEKNNYQFSARAMIDRYKHNDMPLGWIVPNDGYGCGYGQTDSLEGDIKNLQSFAQYSRENGVEVALWTESNLEPAEPDHPKKGDRDLSKEVSVAGVVALKCDVAWIGRGYSFGLNAVENATNIFIRETKLKTRPMIIMVDGWAGTQRYSGIWSGDQSGGQWEYIRFHIPTYIGAGLSGQPVIGSDMDGIYAGEEKEVNIRDYQWKAFTPLQLNMDGWGDTPKNPFSFDKEATTINRAYLKLKSMMMPYNYTIGHESVHGLPMVRAMFLEFPEEPCAHTIDSQYQFMWGPSILVAPVYEHDVSILDDRIRNGIYLPNSNQVWIDFFTGDKYQGGKIYNNIKTPLWKIPVFVKDGAIIPMTNPNNNPYEIKRDHRIFNLYPNEKTSLDIYEDDGISTDYLEGNFAKTKITAIGPKSNEHGNILIHIDKAKGCYSKIVKERTTLIRIMSSGKVEGVKAAINGESIAISKVESDEEFDQTENAYYFKADYYLNPYLKGLATDILLQQRFLLIKIQKTDITLNEIQIKVKGYVNESKTFGSNSTVNQFIKVPSLFTALEEDITATSITLQWNLLDEAEYYDIERDGATFSNIIGNKFTFINFKYNSEHTFRIRSVNDKGVSQWSNYIIAATKEDPHKHVVRGVQVSCSVPCQENQEICKLTDGVSNTLWHTHWCQPNEANPKTGKAIKLNFDLGDVYQIDKVEYTPREDAGNGTLLQIQYRYSDDGFVWSILSSVIHWNDDATSKSIALNGKNIRFMEINVLDSIGGFGSGKHMLFYKKIDKV